MSSAAHTPSNVIYIHHVAPQRALENLNRITGLMFNEAPESLVPHHTADEHDWAIAYTFSEMDFGFEQDQPYSDLSLIAKER